jgi:hypothetical protein
MTALVLAMAGDLLGVEPEGAPAVSQVFPAGGRVGTGFAMELLGDWPEWPVQGWAAAEGVRLTPETDPGRFRVEIAATTAPGPTLLRFHNQAGATAPLQFVVGDAPEIVESADLEASGAGVPIRAFPVVVNGRLLAAEQPDVWLLPVAEPATLTAELLARRLDSPLRTRLELVGERGGVMSEVTTTPDSEPSLSTRLVLPGLYGLRVSVANDESGSSPGVGTRGIYRLRIAVEALPESQADSRTQRPSPSPDIQRPLLTSRVLTPPDSRVAFISRPGRIAVYGLEARARQRYTLQLSTATPAVRFEARLEIQNPESATIATEEGEEIEVGFVAPRAGTYTFLVSAVDGGGGPTHGYTLSLSRDGPEFVGELSTDRLVVSPGGRAAIRLQVTRPPDYQGVLSATVEGLPDGVTAGSAVLPLGVDAVDLVLQVSADAAPANQPFRVNLLPIGGALPRESAATATIKGVNATSPMLLTGATEDIWLTVRKADEP